MTIQSRSQTRSTQTHRMPDSNGGRNSGPDDVDDGSGGREGNYGNGPDDVYDEFNQSRYDGGSGGFSGPDGYYSYNGI